jgi:hypothetical protein
MTLISATINIAHLIMLKRSLREPNMYLMNFMLLEYQI